MAFQKATTTSGKQRQQLSLRSETTTVTVRQVAIMLSYVYGRISNKILERQPTGGDSKQAVNNVMLDQWHQKNHLIGSL